MYSNSESSDENLKSRSLGVTWEMLIARTERSKLEAIGIWSSNPWFPGTNPMLFRTETWKLHVMSYMTLLQDLRAVEETFTSSYTCLAPWSRDVSLCFKRSLEKGVVDPNHGYLMKFVIYLYMYPFLHIELPDVHLPSSKVACRSQLRWELGVFGVEKNDRPMVFFQLHYNLLLALSRNDRPWHQRCSHEVCCSLGPSPLVIETAFPVFCDPPRETIDYLNCDQPKWFCVFWLSLSWSAYELLSMVKSSRYSLWLDLTMTYSAVWYYHPIESPEDDLPSGAWPLLGPFPTSSPGSKARNLHQFFHGATRLSKAPKNKRCFSCQVLVLFMWKKNRPSRKLDDFNARTMPDAEDPLAAFCIGKNGEGKFGGKDVVSFGRIYRFMWLWVGEEYLK